MRQDTSDRLERSFKGIVAYIVVLFVVLLAIPLTYSDNQFLQSEYVAMNRQVFGGSLPNLPVRWVVLKDDVYGRTIGESAPQYIEINPRANTSLWELQNTLAHEMCHVKEWHFDQGEHDEAFQYCVADAARKMGRDFYDIF